MKYTVSKVKMLRNVGSRQPEPVDKIGGSRCSHLNVWFWNHSNEAVVPRDLLG